MHDPDFLNKEAENKIASELLKYEIIVAKPMVDKLGADLLAMLRVDDGARFIRVQSKGRSLEKSKSCHIEIPKDYVTESFVCFLYLRQPSKSNVILSIFFFEDMQSWTLNQKDEYTFSVSAGTYLEKLHPYEFNDEKTKRLISVIQKADVEKQFNILIDLHSYPLVLGYGKSNNRVTITKLGGVYIPIIKDTITGTESYGSDCPGNPDDFDYDPAMDIWTAK